MKETLPDKFKKIITDSFPKIKAVVLGDFMLDEYISGNVERISPEAPVPVLNYNERSRVAGGAGNVAKNVCALGAEVYVAGIIGNDAKGTWLKNQFAEYGINTDGLFSEYGKPTTVKTRFAVKGHQLLRVDRENKGKISSETEDLIASYLEQILPQCDLLIMSDYQKGVLLNPDFVLRIADMARSNNVLCSIDSKTRNVSAFKNLDFVKHNNFELEGIIGFKIESESSLDEAGKEYLKRSEAKALVLTKGERGISVFVQGKSRLDFPAKPLQVFDVTGAGDTVLSVVSLGLASGLSIFESAQLANLAASVVIAKVGTAVVTRDELLQRINTENCVL